MSSTAVVCLLTYLSLVVLLHIDAFLIYCFLNTQKKANLQAICEIYMN